MSGVVMRTEMPWPVMKEMRARIIRVEIMASKIMSWAAAECPALAAAALRAPHQS